MSRILVVCPVERDYRELRLLALADQCTFHFDEPYNRCLEEILFQGRCQSTVMSCADFLDQLLARARLANINGVISSDDYPGSIFAALVANNLGLPTPKPELVIGLQHKYISRLWQCEFVPEAVPRFWLVNERNYKEVLPSLSFPVIVKPVKSKFSINAMLVTTEQELIAALEQAKLPRSFLDPFAYCMQHYSPYRTDPYGLLIEEAFQGKQCTLEGFVWDNVVSCVGVVDSIMYPGTDCFERFVYPSQLPIAVQTRMTEIAQRLMKGIGFNNGFFNIEYRYDKQTDTIGIIEINPRLCNQFADLYHKVSDIHTYEIALAIACGKKPHLIPKKGSFGIAASCVLRLFCDHYVHGIPSKESIQKVQTLYPDIRIEIYARPGYYLSDEKQDGKSFRYAVINLGGYDVADLNDRLQNCKKLLTFSFEAHKNP